MSWLVGLQPTETNILRVSPLMSWHDSIKLFPQKQLMHLHREYPPPYICLQVPQLEDFDTPCKLSFLLNANSNASHRSFFKSCLIWSELRQL